MIQPLDIDFIRRRRPVSLACVVLLLAGLVTVGVTLSDYLDARNDLERLEARQARMQRGQRQESLALRRAEPAAQPLAEIPTVDSIAARLRLPWDAMLQELERHADAPVALLSVESQGHGRGLRLTGEAKSMADVLAYVSRLGASPRIGSATLSGHEARMAGAVRVIRFSLDVTWSPGL